MINQLSSSITNKNVFAPLQSSDARYLITKPFTEKQQNDFDKEQEKKTNRLGYKIGKVSLAVGLGLLVLAQIFSKRSGLRFNKYFQKLEEKVAEMSQNQKLNKLQTLYLQALKGAKGLLKYSKVLFTFNSLKDVLYIKTLEKTPTTKKFSHKITNFFETIAVGRSKKAYLKTNSKFVKMYDCFDFANSKIADKNKQEELRVSISRIKENYDKTFGVERQNFRMHIIRDRMKNLHEEFWKKTYANPKQFIKDPKSRTTFVAEEIVAGTKLDIINRTLKAQKIITFGVQEKCASATKLLEEIDSFIDPKDTDLRKLVKEVRKNIQNYKNLKDESAQKLTVDKLSELNNAIKNNKDYDSKINEQISKIISHLQSKEQGEIQKVMATYKELVNQKVITPKEYAKIEKTVEKALKSLDKSVDLETDKLFDKIRDLRLGSAPHDVISLLTSAGIVGYGLTKAKDHDERISVSLKYGIPAIGAVSMSLYCTLGLVSGGKSLAIGFISGLVMNKLGVFADKKLKEYKQTSLSFDDATKILPKFKSELEGN